MKVSNIGPAKGTDKSKRKSGVSSSDAFADDLRAATSDGAEPAAGMVSGGGVAGIDAVLALQAADDATQGRSRGLLMARGDRLLDRLEDLQVALLSGSIAKDKVVELAQTLREQRPQSDDRELNSLLDEIEVLREEVVRVLHELVRDLGHVQQRVGRRPDVDERAVALHAADRARHLGADLELLERRPLRLARRPLRRLRRRLHRSSLLRGGRRRLGLLAHADGAARPPRAA